MDGQLYAPRHRGALLLRGGLMDRVTQRKAWEVAAQAAVTPIKVNAGVLGDVYVRRMTVEEVDASTDDAVEVDKKRRLARSAARVIYSEDGQLLFDPANAEDLTLIAKQPWELLHLILAAARADAVPNA